MTLPQDVSLRLMGKIKISGVKMIFISNISNFKTSFPAVLQKIHRNGISYRRHLLGIMTACGV